MKITLKKLKGIKPKYYFENNLIKNTSIIQIYQKELNGKIEKI